MRNFIRKVFWFTAPFIFLYGLTVAFYQKDQGDLVRLGFLFSNPAPHQEVAAQFTAPPMKFQNLSQQDLEKGGSWDAIVFGDSFGDQQAMGFQNYFAQHGYHTLHVDRPFTEESPLQNLVGMINSGFFDKFHTKYVILESVERMTMIRTENLDLAKVKPAEETKAIWQSLQPKNGNAPKLPDAVVHALEPIKFFTDATVKAPFINLQYLFVEHPFKGDTWKIHSTSNRLFLNNPENILVFKNDIQVLKQKNNPEKIQQVNQGFNNIAKLLEAKGIKLIVLIPPDKYDVYFSQMKNPEKRTPSQFWNILHSLPKQYTLIPMDKILHDRVTQQVQDVYYYDDTHWSPVGAKAAGDAIAAEIK